VFESWDLLSGWFLRGTGRSREWAEKTGGSQKTVACLSSDASFIIAKVTSRNADKKRLMRSMGRFLEQDVEKNSRKRVKAALGVLFRFHLASIN